MPNGRGGDCWVNRSAFRDVNALKTHERRVVEARNGKFDLTKWEAQMRPLLNIKQFVHCIILCMPVYVLSAHAYAQAMPHPNHYVLEITPREVWGARADTYKELLAPDGAYSFWVYEPKAHSAPAGVVLYVSPISTGQMRDGWESVHERQNMVWVGANDAGNRGASTAQRILLAMLGRDAMALQRPIDNDRVFIGGFSGGGRASSIAISKFPDQFAGAFFIGGVNFWAGVDNDVKDKIIQKPFVFITGRDDFNRTETRNIYRKYKRAGAQKLLLLDLPYLAHETPRAEDYETALEFLSNNSRADD